jgi:subtilase family serine protease
VAARATDGLTPAQWMTAYGVAGLHRTGLSGQGQIVALSEVTPVNQSDLTGFAKCFGLKAPPLKDIDTGVASPQLSPARTSNARAEAALDSEVVAAAAPRLRAIEVFVGRDNNELENFIEQFSEVIDPRLGNARPSVLSVSFSECEPELSVAVESVALINRLVEADAVAGVTVAAGSGDFGSAGCGAEEDVGSLAVSFPSSSSYVTAVGGTELTLHADNTIAAEDAWNDLPDYRIRAAGGGGQSLLSTQPWYQSGLGQPCCERLVPDVAFDALAKPGYAVLCQLCLGARSGWSDHHGGTSAATPLFAAGIALAMRPWPTLASRASASPTQPSTPSIRAIRRCSTRSTGAATTSSMSAAAR